MADSDTNGRTHEPDLRELTAEVDGLDKLFKAELHAVRDLMNERDKHYSERDRDRQAEVGKAQAALEKAIAKAEQAQDTYNKTHNDLLREMRDERAEIKAEQMPRPEIESKFQGVEKQIQELRESSVRSGGQQIGAGKTKEEGRAIVLIIIAIIGSLMGMASFLVVIMKG